MNNFQQTQWKKDYIWFENFLSQPSLVSIFFLQHLIFPQKMNKVQPQVIQRVIVLRYTHNFLLPVFYPQNNPHQIIDVQYRRPHLDHLNERIGVLHTA